MGIAGLTGGQTCSQERYVSALILWVRVESHVTAGLSRATRIQHTRFSEYRPAVV